MTDKLQLVFSSAARIFSNMRKFNWGLAHFWRSELRWLELVDRVPFRVCGQVFRYLHIMVPGHCHLQSADRGYLDFPMCQTGYVRETCICLRRPIKLELTFCPPQRQ